MALRHFTARNKRIMTMFCGSVPPPPPLLERGTSDFGSTGSPQNRSRKASATETNENHMKLEVEISWNDLTQFPILYMDTLPAFFPRRNDPNVDQAHYHLSPGKATPGCLKRATAQGSLKKSTPNKPHQGASTVSNQLAPSQKKAQPVRSTAGWQKNTSEGKEKKKRITNVTNHP